MANARDAEMAAHRDALALIAKLRHEGGSEFSSSGQDPVSGESVGLWGGRPLVTVSLVSVRCLKQLGHAFGKSLFDSVGKPEL